MYIKKIEFTNFRGFQELSLDLPENLAVFIGWNGSGKTTILDGIHKFILAYIYEIINDSEEGLDYKNLSNAGIQLDDIHNNEEKSSICIKVGTGSMIDNSCRFAWILSNNQGVIENDDFSLHKYKEKLDENFRKDMKCSLPITVYYQTSALKTPRSTQYKEVTLIKNDNNRSLVFFQALAYQNSKINAFNDYNAFKKWFKDQEDSENAVIVNQQNLNYRNDKLEIVRIALENFLSQLENANFLNLRVLRPDVENLSSKSIPDKLELTILKDNIELKLSQLSDGEKKCILIVADIARRLAIANPGLEVFDVLKQGKGIILIDEIEAHLHPGWQREIIPALTKTFPSCQFIVTTHSPQVLSKVKSENIFILEDGMVINAKDAGYHTYGRTSNSILSELFDIRERPPEFKDRINNCLKLIDEGFKSKDDDKIQQAKDELSKLEKELGEDDLDIINVSTTLRFRSKLKRKK